MTMKQIYQNTVVLTEKMHWFSTTKEIMKMMKMKAKNHEIVQRWSWDQL